MNLAYRRVERRADNTLPDEDAHGCFYLALDGGQDVGLVEIRESFGKIDFYNDEYFYTEPYILVRRTPEAVVWIENSVYPYSSLFEKCAVFVFERRQYCETLGLDESWFLEIPQLSGAEQNSVLMSLLPLIPSHRAVETVFPPFRDDETGRSLVKLLREDIESGACTVDWEENPEDEWTEYELYSRGSLCLCVEHNERLRGWRVLLPSQFPVRFRVRVS
jgi:hypothetical protein